MIPKEFDIFFHLGIDRYSAFLVSEEFFNEIFEEGVYDSELREIGFRAIRIVNVPVLFSSELKGRTIVPLEKDLVKALANCGK